MEAFNLQPTAAGSDSLACGAIAIDPRNPDRVYVGTGEGDNVFIQGTVVAGTGAYFGVGPIRSDDGGLGWHTEPTAPGSPSLAGASFYRLAVDQGNGDHVIAASILGLYRREPDGAGGFHWRLVEAGIFTSVVAARRNNVTTFYAANFGGTCWTSSDGVAWKQISTGFPSADVGRIGLAVQPGNPEIVYALICRASDFHLLGVWRYDATSDAWTSVSGAPQQLFGPDPNNPGQGTYDLAILVDPADANRIYLGGATELSGAQFAACLYRADVSTGPALTMTLVAIGGNVHADVHTLEFTPDKPDQLWVGCDGGVFVTSNASASADFEPRNIGLATITVNRLATHPDQDAVLFCGTQDNGTVRYTGEEAWLHCAPGDGGHVVVNPADPYTVLRTYVQNILAVTTDGGQGYDSWTGQQVPLSRFEGVEFYPPLAGPTASENLRDGAGTVAFGSVRPWVSTDFGNTWRSIPNDNFGTDSFSDTILSLNFAAPGKFYAGTQQGEVYRCENSGGTWTVTPIHAEPLLSGPVTGIAVDPADSSGNSIYVCFGGSGDFRHVWHFGAASAGWQPRSGPARGQSLMDVHHNAIVVDEKNPSNLYAGADIGVWRSTDAGSNWEPYAEGLPEAAVLDLKIHPKRRLLWAATYGRGVYERALDLASALPVELYVRHTQLDRGIYPTLDGLPDPLDQTRKASFRSGPDLKLDPPSVTGTYQTPTNQLNFFQYVDGLTDAGSRIATGLPLRVNRVYVQVHNRGVIPARLVQVILLLAPAVNGLPPDLPAGYDALVRAGSPIATAPWQTIGIQTLKDLRVGVPLVAPFDLPSDILPTPAGSTPPAGNTHCLVVLVHSSLDPYTNPAVNVDALSLGERKATQRFF
ncbi:MAG TPA: hypothetical protein VGZ73_07275 [Bryobacteraceae bacterium]|nr:hypothetical protein [Bryobacteraceae bacterium]